MRKVLIFLLVMAVCLPLVAHAEILPFANEQLKLSFDLPEGWTQADADDMFVFLAPDESGVIIVSPTDSQVTPDMIEGFSEEVVREWIEEQGVGGFTNIQSLFFAKATDADGNLYVLTSCGCMVGDVPYIYSLFFFTAIDGTLSAVMGISVNNEAGGVTLAWFDQMIVDNIPADVMEKLTNAIGFLREDRA